MIGIPPIVTRAVAVGLRNNPSKVMCRGQHSTIALQMVDNVWDNIKNPQIMTRELTSHEIIAKWLSAAALYVYKVKTSGGRPNHDSLVTFGWQWWDNRFYPTMSLQLVVSVGDVKHK
jgi:hypothetical protein